MILKIVYILPRILIVIQYFQTFEPSLELLFAGKSSPVKKVVKPLDSEDVGEAKKEDSDPGTGALDVSGKIVLILYVLTLFTGTLPAVAVPIIVDAVLLSKLFWTLSFIGFDGTLIRVFSFKS